MRNFLLVVTTLFVLAACSHNIREDFDQPFEKYNDMVAMNNMDGSVLFVADKAKETYMASLAAAKNTRIFEYRVLNKQIDEKSRTAKVLVEFSYYMLNKNRVKTLRYMQQWSWLEKKEAEGWRLLTPLPEFK